ncbi:MAG: PilZ domain-containing protein [Desulfovibrionales bacterium]|nr:PilZ domain-containing protein [Desulfovibrionales bacterium]
MLRPKICPNCKGTKALLYFDAVYYYIVCERCGMSGARSLTEDDAITLWNSHSETTFTYEKKHGTSTLQRILPCETQRNSRRFPVNIPVVITLTNPHGKKVTGLMRNISPYGAFLRLQGHGLDALPHSVEELTTKRVFVYYKNPLPPSAPKKQRLPLRQLELLPRHMLFDHTNIGVGGCFKSPNASQLRSIQALVDYAREL